MRQSGHNKEKHGTPLRKIHKSVALDNDYQKCSGIAVYNVLNWVVQNYILTP